MYLRPCLTHPYLSSSLLIEILPFPQGKLKYREFSGLSGRGVGLRSNPGRRGNTNSDYDCEALEVTRGAGRSLLLPSGISHSHPGLQPVSVRWTLCHLQTVLRPPTGQLAPERHSVHEMDAYCLVRDLGVPY